MSSCIPGTVLGFKDPDIRHLACPCWGIHVPHKKEEWKRSSTKVWNTPNFLWYTINFLLIIPLELPTFSVLRQKALHFVPKAKSRMLDWGEPRLMDQENAYTSQAFCCRTHRWHIHLAAIWKTRPPKRRGRKCSVRFYYPLLEEKWPIAWMFPKRMFSCAPCVFQTPIERKNNGWRLGGGWNWVMNLHFKDCDLCWSNYLFTWENKECLFMELPQQMRKLRNAYRFNIV